MKPFTSVYGYKGMGEVKTTSSLHSNTYVFAEGSEELNEA